MPIGIFNLSLWISPFPISGESVLILSFIVEILVLDANSEDTEQTLRSAGSDLGLYCLPISLLLHARHKWVG